MIRHPLPALVIALAITFGTGCHSAPGTHPEVVFVDCPDHTGSAVQVTPNLILTAKHVLPDAVCHPTLDLALALRWAPHSAPFARLSSRLPMEGERLTLVGFGGGSGIRWTSQGFQSDTRGWCTCPGWYGDSGGAVFDESGYLIGIAVCLEKSGFQTIAHHLEYVSIHDAAKWLRAHGITVE